MSKAILLIALLLAVSAASDYRLDRMGPTQEMCSDNFSHLALEGIDICSEQDCVYVGPSTGFMAITCNATVELFNKTLIQFGSGRNFSIEWQFKDSTCKEVNVIEAIAVASCEGAPSLGCQSGHIDACVYIPQGLPPIVTEPPTPVAAPVSEAPPIPPPTPVPVADVPVAPPTPETWPLAEPLVSPVDAPLAQQQAPKGVAQETALTTFEKFVVGVSTSGWGLALVFIVLYLYLRQKNKGHNYVPLVEEHDAESPPPSQPTVITSDNKNVLKPILQDTKSRIPNIPASELIIDKTKKLGEGQACQVYEGLWRQKKVAIKIPRDRDATKLMKELIVRSEIDPHPNIVEVYGYFEYEDRICLVLELCNCPNLENLAKQDLSLSDKFAIAMGIASGILHLHHSKRQVIHRDLKPSNILVAKSGSHLIPKIADFDYSRLLSSPKGVTMSTPTTSYAAPEQLAASANAKKEYSVKSDAWAYGAILFYLLTGQTPFAVQNTNALKTQRLNKQALVRFELLDTLPVDPFTSLLVDITRKCLNDDPNKRPMFDRIDNEFADFFNKFYPIYQNRESNNNNANLQ